MHPLIFSPLYRTYLWGGRKFASRLGRSLPEGDTFAESWELVDHGEDQSVVRAGPLAGISLHTLVREHGPTLMGRHAGVEAFPLLFKFLDAKRDLSVQVHPDDTRAATLSPPDRGKTEAWYVVDAEPESQIYAGLREGVRTEDLLTAIKREFREHEDLPNTTNPDDWAKISGKKGERIVFIRTLVDEGRVSSELAGGRAIERTATGQYL